MRHRFGAALGVESWETLVLRDAVGERALRKPVLEV